MPQIKQHEEYTSIHREDGKVVLAGQGVYEHIGLHGEVGSGSVFSGDITPQMINSFLETANIPDNGGGISANFPGGGYLLVKPFESAMKLQGATVGTTVKEDRGRPVEVTAVHTDLPITDFATDETTMLVFPYNPAITEETDKNQGNPGKTNKLVKSIPELASALEEGRLYALATAFPGGWAVEGQNVPRSSEWGGTENPTWAVIIPDGQKNQVVERWNKLAGTL